MPVTVPIEGNTEAEAALRRQAAFVAEMHQLAQSAPAGQAVHLAQAHALGRGRQLLGDTPPGRRPGPHRRR